MLITRKRDYLRRRRRRRRRLRLCDSLSTDLIRLLTNMRLWQSQVPRKSCVYTLSCDLAPRSNGIGWLAVDRLSESESVAVTRSAEKVAPGLRNSDSTSPTASTAPTRIYSHAGDNCRHAHPIFTAERSVSASASASHCSVHLTFSLSRSYAYLSTTHVIWRSLRRTNRREL